MKKLIATFCLLLPFATTAFGANVNFPGKITEIRRESNSITCAWSDLFLMVKVTGPSSSVWLRLAESQTGYHDILSMLLTAYTASKPVTVIYENNSDDCTAGTLPSAGILRSISLTL